MIHDGKKLQQSLTPIQHEIGWVTDLQFRLITKMWIIDPNSWKKVVTTRRQVVTTRVRVTLVTMALVPSISCVYPIEPSVESNRRNVLRSIHAVRKKATRSRSITSSPSAVTLHLMPSTSKVSKAGFWPGLTAVPFRVASRYPSKWDHEHTYCRL